MKENLTESGAKELALLLVETNYYLLNDIP